MKVEKMVQSLGWWLEALMVMLKDHCYLQLLVHPTGQWKGMLTEYLTVENWVEKKDSLIATEKD
jgi:hypothetical protein